jgi:DNA-binding response OmpR family regulator
MGEVDSCPARINQKQQRMDQAIGVPIAASSGKRIEGGHTVVLHRILLADGDEKLLYYYRTALSHEGFNVQIAATGLDCVARLRTFRPDLLILEPTLPWGSGEGVLALLSEDPSMPEAAVMVLTDQVNLDDVYEIAGFPISAYYAKPVTARELAQCIRQLRRKQSTRRRAEKNGVLIRPLVPATPPAPENRVG